MSAAAKRTFLYRAFHPLGPHVCDLSGMLGESHDVTDAELNATQHALDSVPDTVIEYAMQRANWMVDVIKNDDWWGARRDEEAICDECGEMCYALTLQEILVKFYLALKLEEFDAQLVR